MSPEDSNRCVAHECLSVCGLILHLRSTRARRQTELFEDTMLELFKSDIESKYGLE